MNRMRLRGNGWGILVLKHFLPGHSPVMARQARTGDIVNTLNRPNYVELNLLIMYFCNHLPLQSIHALLIGGTAFGLPQASTSCSRNDVENVVLRLCSFMPAELNSYLHLFSKPNEGSPAAAYLSRFSFCTTKRPSTQNSRDIGSLSTTVTNGG